MKKFLILPAVLLFISCSGMNDREDVVRNGSADLSEKDFSRNISLSGTWDFFPDLVTPDYRVWEEIEVPSPWKEDFGDGTYHLEVKLPREKSHYSLYIPNCSTSYRLIMNGEEFANGAIGDNYSPTLKPRVFQISAAGSLSITINVTDRDTTHRGLISAPWLGEPEKIQALFTLYNSIDALSIGALILSGLFSFGVWFVDRKNSENNHHILALISFWMVIRFLTDYNHLILLFISNYTLHEKLTWFNIPVIVSLFALYFRRIFDYRIYRKMMDVAIALSVIYGATVLLGSVKLAYAANVPYELSIVIPMSATIFVTVYDIFYGRKSLDSLYWLGVMVCGIVIFGGNSLFQFRHSVLNTQIFAALIVPFQTLFTYIPYRKVYERNTRLLKHKNDLFMRISDSLRTPLFGITGTLDLLKNRNNRGESLRPELDEIETCAGKLSDQIDYLLSVSRADVISKNTMTLLRDPVNRPRILLIDDVKINRSILKEQIRETFKNAHIVDFESGKDALEFLENNAIDCIFCDLVMPEMDGFEFTRTCRRKGYLTPLFIFSASMNEDNRKKALSLGADGYLEKPLRLARIRELFELYL